MEYAVYRIFEESGQRRGKFVNMLASREEAEDYAEDLEGEHEVVGLWTREITEEEGALWELVEFREDGGFYPARTS